MTPLDLRFCLSALRQDHTHHAPQGTALLQAEGLARQATHTHSTMADAAAKVGFAVGTMRGEATLLLVDSPGLRGADGWGSARVAAGQARAARRWFAYGGMFKSPGVARPVRVTRGNALSAGRSTAAASVGSEAGAPPPPIQGLEGPGAAGEGPGLTAGGLQTVRAPGCKAADALGHLERAQPGGAGQRPRQRQRVEPSHGALHKMAQTCSLCLCVAPSCARATLLFSARRWT